MPVRSSDEGKRWLLNYRGLYNGRRSHMALDGLSPQQWLNLLLNDE
jgi:transposase InsO family protein